MPLIAAWTTSRQPPRKHLHSQIPAAGVRRGRRRNAVCNRRPPAVRLFIPYEAVSTLSKGARSLRRVPQVVAATCRSDDLSSPRSAGSSISRDATRSKGFPKGTSFGPVRGVDGSTATEQRKSDYTEPPPLASGTPNRPHGGYVQQSHLRHIPHTASHTSFPSVFPLMLLTRRVPAEEPIRPAP